MAVSRMLTSYIVISLIQNLPFLEAHSLDVVHGSDLDSGDNNDVMYDGPDVNDYFGVDLEEYIVLCVLLLII